MNLFKLGWRNIFRNKRRTLLTASVIGIGLATLIFLDALFIGMMDHIVDRATGMVMGHGQIHANTFRTTLEADKTVNNLGQVIRLLDSSDSVDHYSLRVVTTSMLSSPRNMVSVTLYGIDPTQEKNLSQVHRAMRKGSFLPAEEQAKILLGDELAELLEVNLGDRIVATGAQAHSGELAQELFRVGGMFHFGDPYLDRTTAFVLMPHLQKMLAIGNDIHEVAITFHDPDAATAPIHPFWLEAAATDNEALSWQKLVPSLHALLDLSKYSTFITGVILFVLVVFIIMNTLFMALFERMVEFGILRAIGTRPFKLSLLILIEAGSIALISAAVGSLLGVSIVGIVSVTGIDYSGIDIGGVTFADPIYPSLRWYQLTVFPAALVAFTLLAAVFPAISAARVIPVKALQQKGQ